MRRAGFVALLVAILIVQIGFLPAWRPLGVVPDLLLVVVVLTGLMATVSQALVLALIGGILLDVASGTDFGLRTGVLVLTALATGMVRRAGIDLIGPIMALVVAAAATIIENLLILGNLIGVAESWPIGSIIGKLALVVMLNLILTLVFRPLVGWLQPTGTPLPRIE